MIKLGLILCIAACNVFGQMNFRSDYKYYQQVGGWMKYHIVPSNWNNARIRCFLEGGIIASPLNEELTAIMINEMRERKISALFTGIHATYSKGDFFSMEGVPLRNIPTTRGFPDIDQKNDDEDCMIIRSPGTLADVRCAEVYSYMCYKKHDPSKDYSQGECGTIDKEYKYSEITGHCYKLNPAGETWSRAFMTCAAEGAYLAIINNEDEAQVIRELYGNFPNDKLIGSKHSAHLGYKAEPDTNFWMTIHGQTPKEAGYANWDNRDNKTTAQYPSGQNCGGMFGSTRLDDVYCDVISPFICEKLPDALKD